MPDKTFEDVYKTNPEDETNKKVSHLDTCLIHNSAIYITFPINVSFFKVQCRIGKYIVYIFNVCGFYIW